MLLSSSVFQYSTIFTNLACSINYINMPTFSFHQLAALSITHSSFSRSSYYDVEQPSTILHTIKKLNIDFNLSVKIFHNLSLLINLMPTGPAYFKELNSCPSFCGVLYITLPIIGPSKPQSDFRKS